MIDHASLQVRDLLRAAAFYEAVLAPLGYRRMVERETQVGFGKRYPELWLNARPQGVAAAPDTGAHLCLRAPDAASVRAFHAAALEAGGRDDGAPGPRAAAQTEYFAAFVRDLDGNRIEAAFFDRTKGDLTMAHEAVIEWTMGEGDFLTGRYSRAHTLSFDGGAVVRASASPSVVRPPFSDPAAVDPEEMLVASLASCHMLWFLDYAKHAGFSVHRYRDEPQGHGAKNAAGHDYMESITLRPRAEFDGPAPTAAVLMDLHHKAHAACYIANSLRAEVVIEPVAT